MSDSKTNTAAKSPQLAMSNPVLIALIVVIVLLAMNFIMLQHNKSNASDDNSRKRMVIHVIPVRHNEPTTYADVQGSVIDLSRLVETSKSLNAKNPAAPSGAAPRNQKRGGRFLPTRDGVVRVAKSMTKRFFEWRTKQNLRRRAQRTPAAPWIESGMPAPSMGEWWPKDKFPVVPGTPSHDIYKAIDRVYSEYVQDIWPLLPGIFAGCSNGLASGMCAAAAKPLLATVKAIGIFTRYEIDQVIVDLTAALGKSFTKYSALMYLAREIERVMGMNPDVSEDFRGATREQAIARLENIKPKLQLPPEGSAITPENAVTHVRSWIRFTGKHDKTARNPYVDVGVGVYIAVALMVLDDSYRSKAFSPGEPMFVASQILSKTMLQVVYDLESDWVGTLQRIETAGREVVRAMEEVHM